MAPSASTTRDARPVTRPTSTITPSATATSAARAGAPVPSTTVPPRTIRSCTATPDRCSGQLSTEAPIRGSAPHAVTRCLAVPGLVADRLLAQLVLQDAAARVARQV